jgi:phosphoglycolate phosphatase
MMITQGVVFDLDGTLADSLADIRLAANDVLRHFDCPEYSLEEYNFLVGDGARILFERAIPVEQHSEALISACMADFKTRYATQWRQHTCLYDGIDELLGEIVQREWRLGILSNKPHDFTVEIVSHLLGKYPFDPFFGKREGVAAKPDPVSLLEIATLWNVEPAQILYVGDTNTDMQTGTAAGAITIGVTWGFRPESELRASGADRIATRPLDVLPA